MRYFALAFLVLFLACGDSRGSSDPPPTYTTVPRGSIASTLADTLCRLWTQQCGCDRNFFGTPEQCRSSSTSYLEGQFAEAEAAGLSYDPECGAAAVNLYNQDIACKLESEVTADASRALQRPYCKVFYGTHTEGMECESFAQAQGDSCVQGMQCLGTCVPVRAPRTVRSVGEPCDVATDICELGSLCRGSADGTTTECVAPPSLGEPCLSAWGCEAPYYCDGETSVCTELPGAGAPCILDSGADAQCAAGAACVDGTCMALPGAGEPCADTFDIRCGPGAYCSSDTGVCEPTLEEGAPCGSDSECTGELVCREDASDDHHCLPEEPLICI